MNESTAFQFYSSNLDTLTKQLHQLRKRNKLFSWIRGLWFVIAIIIIVLIRHSDYRIIIATILALTIPFVLFIKYHIKLQHIIDFTAQLELINQNELEALKGNHSNFADGNQFINPNHQYSYDLDIFGDGSIFQFLNRTCTNFGTSQLAHWLQNPALSPEEIISRQDAVTELKNLKEWRQSFQANGNLANDKTDNSINDNQNLKDWFDEPSTFYGNKFYSILLIVMPIIAIALTTLLFVEVLTFSKYIYFILLQLGIVAANARKINRLHGITGRKYLMLRKYAELLSAIEKQNFKCNRLTTLQNKLLYDGVTASEHLNHFSKLIQALDNRLNVLFAILSNVLVLWDLQCALRIERWKVQFKSQIPLWFEAIAEIDTLASFAAVAYNNPEFTLPTLTTNNPVLSMKNGGHPLIHKNQRVCNDFEAKELGYAVIVTGANMAGKSTFLRTVGVNSLLAMVGSVVCADSFTIKPLQIFTSIRTTDSLQKSESYFLAELKRLHAIVEELKNGNEMLIMIDEMLRGTNSNDKHEGSRAMVSQLIHHKAIGFIATHDIALGELTAHYKGKATAVCFEIEMHNNELTFDYKLHEGISQNLNAVFLMKRMGIIDK